MIIMMINKFPIGNATIFVTNKWLFNISTLMTVTDVANLFSNVLVCLYFYINKVKTILCIEFKNTITLVLTFLFSFQSVEYTVSTFVIVIPPTHLAYYSLSCLPLIESLLNSQWNPSLFPRSLLPQSARRGCRTLC
jgi:hypothetical protein